VGPRTSSALQPFKLSNTVKQDLPLDQETVIHDASWFGQATLDIKSQLYLSAALRNDGSSTFGRSNLRSWSPRGVPLGSSPSPQLPFCVGVFPVPCEMPPTMPLDLNVCDVQVRSGSWPASP